MVNPGRDLRDTATPYKVVLLAFLLLGAGLLFRELVTLIVAILVTILIAIPLSALADRLERYGVPRFIGALLGLIIGFGVLIGVLALVIPSFVDELELFVDEPGKLIGPVTSLGISVAGVLGAIALIAITAYYMAVRPDPLVRSVASL